MGTRALKSWCFVHKWTSLICTLFMLMLCLTGLPLIFHHEIDHLLGTTVEPPDLPTGTPEVPLDDILAKAKEMRPGDVVQYIARLPDEPDMWFINMAEDIKANEPTAIQGFDARTGEWLYDYPHDEGIMAFILTLHIDMFAGLPGMLFLGFMGLLLVVSLISGTVIYGPFMRKLDFGTVRRKRTRSTYWLDIHNLLGIVTLAWFLIVGGTGVINTLARPILGLWQMTSLAEMTKVEGERPDSDELFPVAAVPQRALEVSPEKEFAFIAMPGTPFAGESHYIVFVRGTEPFSQRLIEPVPVDVMTGEAVGGQGMPWYVTTLLVSQPLHFGDYGGMPLKILWTVLDILTIIVLGSGLYLWVKKKDNTLDALLRRADVGEESAPPIRKAA